MRFHPDDDANALMAICHENPDDLYTPLILADRFDELREGPRAKLCRVQCKIEEICNLNEAASSPLTLAQMVGTEPSPPRKIDLYALRREEHSLLSTYGSQIITLARAEDWGACSMAGIVPNAAFFSNPPGSMWTGVFRRGLLEAVICNREFPVKPCRPTVDTANWHMVDRYLQGHLNRYPSIRRVFVSGWRCETYHLEDGATLFVFVWRKVVMANRIPVAVWGRVAKNIPNSVAVVPEVARNSPCIKFASPDEGALAIAEAVCQLVREGERYIEPTPL